MNGYENAVNTAALTDEAPGEAPIIQRARRLLEEMEARHEAERKQLHGEMIIETFRIEVLEGALGALAESCAERGIPIGDKPAFWPLRETYYDLTGRWWTGAAQ